MPRIEQLIRRRNCLEKLYEGLPAKIKEIQDKIDKVSCSQLSLHVKFSTRQQEVLQGVLENLSNKEIGVRLQISERTVKYHVSTMLAKFGGLRSREDLRLMIKGKILPLLIFGLLLVGVIFWPSGLFSQGPSAGFTLLATVPSTQTQYTDTTCPIGQSCSYQITAANAAGESGPTNTMALTVLGVPPVTQAKFSWTPGVGGAAPTQFKIYTGARAPNPPTGLVGVSN